MSARFVVLGLLALAACADGDDERADPTDVADAGGASSSSSSSSSSSGAPGRDAEAPANDAGVDAAAGTGLDPNYAHYARNYALCTGQSLSVGYAGTPALSTTQPYDNQMFVGGVVTPNADAARASFVPLVETGVETLESGFANLTHELAAPLLSARVLAERSHRMFVSCHGVGGYSYAQLRKGTPPYANGLAQLDAAVALSAAAGESLVVRGVTNVHGETDHLQANPDYEATLVEWQHDLETDVQARTGQTVGVPMFQTQMSSFTAYGSTFSAVTLAQLQAHVDHPRVQVLVGPKYFLPYVADGIHLTNEGYLWLGEYHAKAYAREILEGQRWEPVRPTGIVRAGALLTVELLVPVPPLVLDTTLVSDPGNYGFSFDDGSGAPPAIASVALVDATHVAVMLEAAPTGPMPVLSYAFQAPAGVGAGPTTGARGNLRDSDATPSRSGRTLYNWSVHFALSAP